jgi:hypothetical protein
MKWVALFKFCPITGCSTRHYTLHYNLFKTKKENFYFVPCSKCTVEAMWCKII